jgi:putative FmdB family regulatory protein
MPTYSYRCTKCGHLYEKFQKISDESRPRCPECRSKGERQISGGVGIHFKGSGFYITDYGKDGKGGGKDKKKTSKPTPEKKTETKPAKKKGGDS